MALIKFYTSRFQNAAILSVLAALLLALNPSSAFANMENSLLRLDLSQSAETNPLPWPWKDNSSWADLDVEYSLDSFEGIRHVRVDCTRLRSGRVQLIAPAPESVKPGELYRLTFEARSPNGAVVYAKVRASSSPYTAYWSSQFNIETRFAQYDAIVAVDDISAGALFMFILEDTTTIDIRNVSLSRVETLSEAELGPPINLTRNSRFPLGLPDTSMIWRLTPDSKIILDADRLVIGPTGSPALHAKGPPGETLRFDSDLFIVRRRLAEHHAQFMAKGTGKVRFSVLADGQLQHNESFQLSPDWAPIAMTFKPKASSDLHVLRWQVDGEMWMDQVIINAGNEPIDYDAQSRHEVALDLIPSDASIAQIQFNDEPAQLKWAVTGKPGRKTFLEAKLFHVDGAEQSLESIPLQSSEFLEEGTFDLNLWPERPLGTFRLEVRVVDEEANALSPWAEIVWHRVMRPRYWGKDAPDSAFGAHLNSTERAITMAKAVGVNWVRLHDTGSHITKWITVEPQPGRWVFADEDLDRYRDGDLMVLGLFATAPHWASHYKTRTERGNSNYYFNQFFLPLDPEKDYANYVSKLAGRYKGKIDAWEVWNEPWQKRWFGVDFVDGKYVHPEDPYAEYARLTKIASDAARAVNPDVKIVGLNTGHTTRNDEYAVSSVEWSKGVIDAGGLDYADAASVHVYKNDRGGYPSSALDQALAHGVGPNELIERIDMPIWMTEGSSTYSKLDMGFYNRSLPNSVLENNEQLAEGVLRYHVTMLSRNVEKIFLYAMHIGQISDNASFSSLISRDSSLHPSAIAHANLAWHVEDMDFHSVHEIEPKVWMFVWEMEGRSAAVILPENRDAVYRLDTALVPEVRNIWGNPMKGSIDLDVSGALINAPSVTADELIQKFVQDRVVSEAEAPQNENTVIEDEPSARVMEEGRDSETEKGFGAWLRSLFSN